MMAQKDSEASLQTKFDAAVRVIHSLPEDGPFQPSEDMVLMFSSYYKQATLGPCATSRPNGFWDSGAKARWDAWRSLGEMTSEEAMAAYVDDIQLILEIIPMTEEVSELLELLGTFYEEVEGGPEEEEEPEKRAFTRPFASYGAESRGPCQKLLMEGFGDLWDALQKPNENVPATGSDVTQTVTATGSDVTAVVLNGKESKVEAVQLQTKEESSEEEEEEEEEEEDESDKDEDTEDEAELEEEENRGTTDSNQPSSNRVEDWPWGSGVKLVSNGSAAPSVSSTTNSTNSSLNSELEEEELLFQCSTGPLRSASSDVSPGQHCRANRSEDQDFCDSMEHLALGEICGSSRVLSSGRGRSRGLQEEHTTLPLRGVDDARLQGDLPREPGLGLDQLSSSLSSRGRVLCGGSSSSLPGSGSGFCADGEADCGGTASVGRNLNAQIAMALAGLQENMDSMLEKLNALEALTASQTRLHDRHDDHDALPLCRQRPLWWPFHLSPVTMAFTTVWPLVAHWLVLLYLGRRKTPQ